MAANLQPIIDAANKIEDAADAAVTALNGVGKRIQAAVDKALENGATEEQLKPIQDEATELNDKAQALADAIVANTPAEP